MRMILLAALMALAWSGQGCSGWSKLTRLSPGEVNCVTTNSDHHYSRTCYLGTPDGNKIIGKESCAKDDGRITGCTESFR